MSPPEDATSPATPAESAPKVNNSESVGLTAMAKVTVAAQAAASVPASKQTTAAAAAAAAVAAPEAQKDKMKSTKNSSSAGSLKLEDPGSSSDSPSTMINPIASIQGADENGAVISQEVEKEVIDNVTASFMGSLDEDHFEGDEIHVELYDPSAEFEVINKFEDMNLTDEILRGLYVMCYRTPSKIQKKALPLLLANPPRNMIAQSQSGTGKTAAFALTMLCRIDPSLPRLQAICIANTRELASQIYSVIKNMASCTTITCLLAVPDTDREEMSCMANTQVVVGTPGTILNQVKRNRNALSHLRVFVLDEADSMLQSDTLGQQTSQLRSMVPRSPDVQFLLFSATFSDTVTRFADTFAPCANKLTLRRDEVKVDSIRQFSMIVNKNTKLQRLSEIYGLMTIGQSIIFVRTRITATQVAAFMREKGHQVSVLMGELPSHERDETMNHFRIGTTKVLIATNVLSRGIDVPQVNLVINYDMPTDELGNPDCETYVHRIGRTGRFGRSGVAINFISDDKSKNIQSYIQKAYAMKIAEMPKDIDEMETMLRKFRF